MELKKDGILPLGILKQATMKLDSFMTDIQEVKEDEDITPEQKMAFEQMIEMTGNMMAAIVNIISSEMDEADFIAETLDMDPIDEYPEAPEVDIMDMEIDESSSYSSNDEPFLEMATIVRDRNEHLLISVNPERDHLNIPYFKVYDSDIFGKAEKVARLHFKDSGMEYHKRDRNGKRIWDINKDIIEEIRKLLQEESADAPGYTNWQYACYRWNYENGLIDAGYQKYFSGDYAEMYKNINVTSLQNAYVPHDQEMPEEWVYDKSKGNK